MDLQALKSSQLYALLQNEKLDQSIRDMANAEMNRRKLSTGELEEIVHEYDLNFKPEKEEGLRGEQKIIILLFAPLLWLFLISNSKDKDSAVYKPTF
jgi:hypothetical protein